MYAPFEFPDPEWTDISEDGDRRNDSHIVLMSLKAKNFVSLLLTKDPEKRITAEQSVQHPWLTVSI